MIFHILIKVKLVIHFRGSSKEGTDNQSNDGLIINNERLALEAGSLREVYGEKELDMRKPKSLTTVATCMESPGLPLAKDS